MRGGKVDRQDQRFNPTRLARRFVPADAFDTWETHSNARLVPRRGLYGIERHLKHQLSRNRTNWSVPVH